MPRRRHLAVLAIGVAVLVTGCAGTGSATGDGTERTATIDPVVTPGPGDHAGSIDIGGETREFLLHAPPSYEPGTPMPLLVALHGRPGSGATMREQSGLDTKADAAGFLVVYPTGIGGGWNDKTCCGKPNPDVEFIEVLLAELGAAWDIDADRIYATGFSNGAAMTYRLAAALPDTFAAIAPVSGGITLNAERNPAEFIPSTPVPLVTILGSGDRNHSAFRQGVGVWNEHRQCSEPVQEEVQAGAPLWRLVSTCADGTPVHVYVYGQMGHAWPDGQGDPGQRSPAAVDVIWAFFDQHAGS